MDADLETANQRIRALRQALQMTRIEFCEQTGMKLTTLENIEKGRQKVHDEHFQAIARHWPEYLFWLVTGEVPRGSHLAPATQAYVGALKEAEKTGTLAKSAEQVRRKLLSDKRKKLD